VSWLTEIPVWLTLPLTIIASAAIAILAHLLFRRFVPPESLVRHHDVATALVSVAGVLYSVVLGFLVVTVWTLFDTAQQTADQEARYVAIAFGYAEGLPNPQRSEMQHLLAQYAVEVRNVEWTVLQSGHQDQRAHELLIEASQTMLAMAPPEHATSAQMLKDQSIAVATTQSLRDIASNRILRLSQARSRLPPAIFEALVLGALLVMSFAFLFGVRPLLLQMTMIGLLAGCIGLFFGLIVDLNAPYSGPIRVSPETWTSVIQSLHLADFAK
jgi:hypothetical protein